jgi:glycosyltransferase involved in cell wall biosynthesis
MEARTGDNRSDKDTGKYGTYFVIVTCRNSEVTIKDALFSLEEQTVRPNYVIVINDGSTDKTHDILEEMKRLWANLFIITNPDLGYDISRISRNWNKAIIFAEEHNLGTTDYHMIATDDTVYPRDYAERVLRHMSSQPNKVIASGQHSDYRISIPTGAGRFIRNSFFYNTYWKGRYPEQIGYEAAIVYQAALEGYKYCVIENAKYNHLRPLGKGHRFYEFSGGMKVLGYHPLFVAARCLSYFITGKITGRAGAIRMLYYYLTFKPTNQGYNSLYHPQLREFVRKMQLKKIVDMMRI